MIDISELIGDPDFSIVMTITRVAGSRDADGNYTTVTTTVPNVAAVVQPASPDDTQALPEGYRNSRAVLVHTLVPLQGADSNSIDSGDRFTYDGKTWLVVSCEDWSDQGYWESIAIWQ